MKNDRKKTILLIVSFIVFIVLIIGTSYAYFSINTGNISNMNVTANITGETTMISSESTACDMNLSINNMSQSRVDNNAAATSNCALTISLSGAQGVKCSYDVVIKEQSTLENANYIPYVPTPGIGVDYNYEFTGTITKDFSDNTNENQNIVVASYNDGDETIEAIGNEIQMNVLREGLYINEELSNGKIAHGTIQVTSSESVTHTYYFTEKWYNIPVPQTSQAGKSYSFVLQAENVIC